MAAFQLDLPGYRFGWRQAAAVTAAAAAVVGMLPGAGRAAWAVGGTWSPRATAEATTWMSATRAQGDFRVLWLGDPRVLPGNGWELVAGARLRRERERAARRHRRCGPGSSPGRPRRSAHGVRLARSHATVRLGRLLAPYAVRYVVVVDTLGALDPRAADARSRIPPPPISLGALGAQIDLRQIISQGGFDVFVDPSALPLRGAPVGARPRRHRRRRRRRR